MSTLFGTILVVNHAQHDANNLKQLIEFMDEPEVSTATPEDWRDELGDRRLGALFIGADLSDAEVKSLLVDLGELDPNVPVVMLNEEIDE